MHSSDLSAVPPGARTMGGQPTGKGRTKGRALLLVLLFALVLAGILFFLDQALYPCTFTRNDLHTVTTQQRDVIILGTSNGKSGIEPEALLEGTGLTGHNLCVGGQYPVDSYYLAKLVIEKQHPSYLIYEVDPGYYTQTKEFGNNYLLFFHEFPLSVTKLQYFADILPEGDFRTIFFPSYEYPLRDEVSRISDNLRKKWTGSYDVSGFKTASMEYHEDGFIERYPVSVEDFPAYSPLEFTRESVDAENLHDLERLITLCRDNDVAFIAVATPIYGGTLQSESTVMQEAWGFFEEYFQEKQLPFYNFNGNYYRAFSHDADCFVDYEGHMNGDAARAFSARLGEILFSNRTEETSGKSDM